MGVATFTVSSLALATCSLPISSCGGAHLLYDVLETFLHLRFLVHLLTVCETGPSTGTLGPGTPVLRARPLVAMFKLSLPVGLFIRGFDSASC